MKKAKATLSWIKCLSQGGVRDKRGEERAKCTRRGPEHTDKEPREEPEGTETTPGTSRVRQIAHKGDCLVAGRGRGRAGRTGGRPGGARGRARRADMHAESPRHTLERGDVSISELLVP